MTKEHKKLYKKGKLWLTATILALAWGTRIRRKQALGGSDQIPGNEEKEEER